MRTGFSRDEVLGKDARNFVIPPDEAPAFGEVLAHIGGRATRAHRSVTG